MSAQLPPDWDKERDPKTYDTICIRCGRFIPNGQPLEHDCPGSIEDRLDRIEGMLKELLAKQDEPSV